VSSIAEARYLELLERTLSRAAFGGDLRTVAPDRDSYAEYLFTLLREELGDGVELVRHVAYDPEARRVGKDWPADAETMIGLERLANVRELALRALDDDVPGDLVETGVWRGGAAILMRAVLAARGITDRQVWVADSFQGLPKPDVERYPKDAGDEHWRRPELAVSREQVAANFERYGLLDDQVRFLEGWFADTLPGAPIESIALLRADGDMYGSTMDTLTALYDRVSPGGFVIIDDYGAIDACKAAVEDFRRDRGIAAPIHEVDWTGVWWQVP
jgi:O-methyltransferase